MYGLSSLLQPTAAERWESTCRKAAHTHHKGKPVSLKQLSKDNNPPLVCQVMQGVFGGFIAEGDRPQQPLACALSGVPHRCCFPSPSGLPACFPPPPSSNWQSLTCMGEHGWATGPSRSSPPGPCVGDEGGWRRASRASVLVSGSSFCVQQSNC